MAAATNGSLENQGRSYQANDQEIKGYPDPCLEKPG